MPSARHHWGRASARHRGRRAPHICTHTQDNTGNHRGHLNALVEPLSFLRARLASADSLFAAARAGLDLALLTLAFSFFRAAFSPEVSWGAFLSIAMSPSCGDAVVEGEGLAAWWLPAH